MFTADAQQLAAFDHSASGSTIRVIATATAWQNPARSDPYVQWATEFDESLNYAAQRVLDFSRYAKDNEDGIEPPTRAAVERSALHIQELRTLVMDRLLPPSTPRLRLCGVSLGSDGEICFELREGHVALTYRVEPDGSITAMWFLRGHLMDRARLDR